MYVAWQKTVALHYPQQKNLPTQELNKELNNYKQDQNFKNRMNSEKFMG